MTARTHLEHGGLLSRGAVEEEGLVQTNQQPDFHDKEMGVYFEIFLDTDDYHTRTNGVNIYGPITFVYKLDLFDDLTNNTLKVTKDNPIRWNIST